MTSKVMDAQLLLQLDGSMLEAQLALDLGHLQLWFYDLIQNSKNFDINFLVLESQQIVSC